MEKISVEYVCADSITTDKHTTRSTVPSTNSVLTGNQQEISSRLYLHLIMNFTDSCLIVIVRSERALYKIFLKQHVQLRFNSVTQSTGETL